MTLLEMAIWILFIGLVWYLPGVAIACFVRDRVRLTAPVFLAICWVAVPVVFSALAVPLSFVGVTPVFLALVLALLGLGLGWRQAMLNIWWREVRRVPILFALPIVLGAVLWGIPDSMRLASDTFAHVSAVKSTVDESAVFPVRGFHGDELSRGADPRFGTLHSFYGVASQLTGTEAINAWPVFRGLGLMVIVAGGLALICTMASSVGGISVGVLALLAATGGAYYNIFAVAAYPLWFSLGVCWSLVAMVFGMMPFQRRSMTVVAGVTLAGLVGIHFFAFMLGGFLLAGVWLAARSGERRGHFWVLLFAALMALPNVVLRFASSYSNENPIHHKIWQCMEWMPGLYSASPLYVASWLIPFGAVALLWAAFGYRRHKDDGRYRWAMICAVLVLCWIGIPWMLTPSMKLIGFLPLRLLMAVGTPFILAFLVEAELSTRRLAVAAVAIVLLSAVVLRVRDVLPSGEHNLVRSPQWLEMLDALPDREQERVVLLSDPFSMLAAHAMRTLDVVAVPDGRSSPRDAQAIDRLRDSWRMMSQAIDGRKTDALIQDRRVTHVLINASLPIGLASYEYPIQPGSFDAQLAKFVSNPGRFEAIWRREGLALFRVNPDPVGVWDEAYLAPCSIPADPADSITPIGNGYELHDPNVEIVDVGGGKELRLRGALIWAGDGSAPDRQLVLRLDRQPATTPRALRAVAKPLRKLKQYFGGPVERYRWTTYPGDNRCPTWVAGDSGAIALDLHIALPARMAEASYAVHLAARDRSIFVPIKLSDLFVDDDSFQGPSLALVHLP